MSLSITYEYATDIVSGIATRRPAIWIATSHFWFWAINIVFCWLLINTLYLFSNVKISPWVGFESGNSTFNYATDCAGVFAFQSLLIAYPFFTAMIIVFIAAWLLYISCLKPIITLWYVIVTFTWYLVLICCSTSFHMLVEYLQSHRRFL